MSGLKKYVSKQDVEKGLVDPTKPLGQQKDYLDKIEKEDREKHPKDKPEYKPKRERPNRPQYNWNRRDVTEETPIPEAPKKQVPRPDKEKYYEKLNAMKKQIEDLNKKKSQLIEEMKSTLRNTSDNKKTTRNVKNKYSAILGQKHGVKKALHEEIKQLEQRREQAFKQLNQHSQKIKSFNKPENFEECSTQELQRRLQKTEQKLTTADLSKKQQNQTNMRITQIKRALLKSKPEVEINAQVSKLNDQKQLLYKQGKDLKVIIDEKYKQLKQVRDEINKLNEELEQEKVEPEDTRSPEQIKADFDKKIDQLNVQKEKIKVDIDKFKEAHNKALDDYEDYSDLVNYIKMVKQQKEKIKSWKQEQERKKKQRQQEEQRRKKQYEERQRKRQEYLKKEQERKKQIEQRKQKLQKQREEYINRNPHQDKINICKILIDYCQGLKPENAAKQFEKRQEKVVQPILELKPSDSKDWEKQLKKGAQVIVSKKFREEQQAPKKVVKQKKKKQTETTATSSGFTHHIDTAKMFEKVNMLPPLTAAQIDETIKQIQERIELFNKPSEQEIKAYKERAEKQFDDLNGFGNDRGKKGRHFKERDGNDHHHPEQQQQHHNEQKQKHKPKKEKNEVVTSEKDFPGLN